MTVLSWKYIHQALLVHNAFFSLLLLPSLHNFYPVSRSLQRHIMKTLTFKKAEELGDVLKKTTDDALRLAQLELSETKSRHSLTN